MASLEEWNEQIIEPQHIGTSSASAELPMGNVPLFTLDHRAELLSR